MAGKSNRIEIAIAIIGIIIHDIMFGIVAYGAYSYCADNEHDEYFKKYGIETYEAFCESFVRNAWSALKAEEHVLDCIKEGYFDNDILRDILN